MMILGPGSSLATLARPGHEDPTQTQRTRGWPGQVRPVLPCGQRRAQPLCVFREHFGLLPFARRRLQGYAGFSRNDVDMQVEHDLAAGGFVELLDGEALGPERADRR